MLNQEYKSVISIPAGDVMLEGWLVVPAGARSLVIFSHGSGSGRYSPRNNFVADLLNRRGIATFLPDLLTSGEDEIYQTRFNINLLTERLIAVTNHLCALPVTARLVKGYFGASTGAASALRAAAILPGVIAAVVSRGGRPDLAIDLAPQVKAPTLLIVGSLDDQVITLNQLAYSYLTCKKEVEIILGAGHFFEEPGTLQRVALLSAGWFSKHLVNHHKKAYSRQK
jgi:dienelactone hydrolase